MYKTLTWLKGIALAEVGYDPSKCTIEEFARTSEIPGEVKKRIDALDAMKNWEGMSGSQFTEAMTTAHFSSYFADALSRMFYQDYNDYAGAWKNYTFADVAPDFREVKRFRMSKPGTLKRRREKAEAKPTGIRAVEISLGVEEYAEQFDVSWQTLVSDDLGKIAETPKAMAQSAKRFEDEFVSNLYDNAVTQATLAALGAPWSGTGRLTAQNLAIGINAMRRRTDAEGNRIMIQQVYLVIPPELEMAAQQILKDLISYGGPNSNVLSGFLAGYYVDPYIATASPNIPWYLFGDPKSIPVVTVARLQNWTAPIVYKRMSDIEMLQGSAPAPFLLGSAATGDIEFTVETVIGGWDSPTLGGVTDFRGLYYSSGTTP